MTKNFIWTSLSFFKLLHILKSITNNQVSPQSYSDTSNLQKGSKTRRADYSKYYFLKGQMILVIHNIDRLIKIERNNITKEIEYIPTGSYNDTTIHFKRISSSTSQFRKQEQVSLKFTSPNQKFSEIKIISNWVWNGQLLFFKHVLRISIP